MTQHRGQMERRFANADDRRRRKAGRRLKTGVVKTGNDMRGNS